MDSKMWRWLFIVTVAVAAELGSARLQAQVTLARGDSEVVDGLAPRTTRSDQGAAAPIYNLETEAWEEDARPHPLDGATDGSLESGCTPDSAAKAAQKKRDEKKAAQKKKAKEKRKKLQAAAAGAYKPLFYENDFSYVTDPAYDGYYFAEGLKQLNLGTCSSPSACTSCTAIGQGGNKSGLTLDFGGQYRFRFHSEQNMRGLGLTGRDDDFLLQRTRLFGNCRFGERLRFYAEYIDAVSDFEQFLPRPIEENRSDMLNLFCDATLLEVGERKLRGRIGRQEMLYGQQRLISPLDWANTRRTFDGGKLMLQGKNFDVDGFWMQPVFPNTTQFDSPISEQQFYGVYSTFKGSDQDILEAYWLAFDDEATGFRSDSLGGRWYAESETGWLAEIWGNYQLGTDSDDSSHQAGAWTVGLGRKSKCGWKPTLWVYYDWASGDGNAPAAGNGYFQYFPLAHKYLGFMDFFGRRNIETPNVQLSVQPTDKLKLLVWYYYFFLQDQRDTPYTVLMTPFAPGVAPGSPSLGYELDLAATYKLSARTGLFMGYSHFFPGAYYDTPGLPYRGDANFCYVQYHINF